MNEAPDIFADRFAQLSPDERAEIRAMITHPLYIRALRIVACHKPSVFCEGTHGGAVDANTPLKATVKLSEIRGWELYEKALFLLLKEPDIVRTDVEATYPDSGRIENEMNPPPGPKKKRNRSHA